MWDFLYWVLFWDVVPSVVLILFVLALWSYKLAVVSNYTRICFTQTSEETTFECLVKSRICQSSRGRWLVLMLDVPVKKFKSSVFLGCMRGSRIFFQEGVGGSRPNCQKTALTTYFLKSSPYFTVLQWFTNGLFQRKL